MGTRTTAGLAGAARTLLRAPLFSGVAAVILALGIGAATAIFTVVDGILLEPLPLPDPDELVAICEQHASLEGYCVASPPTMRDLSERAATLESVGLVRGWTFNVADGDRRLPLRTALATPGFFEVMGARPAAGRLFAADEVGEDADVVLLGHEAWTTWFGGDPDVVGRLLSLDGTPHVVVGVLPPAFELPTLPGVQVWRPLHLDPSDEEHRAWRGFEVVGRRAAGSDLRATRTEIEGIYGALRREAEAVTDEWRVAVVPLKALLVGDVRPTLLVFLGAVGLLLLIACANVANLLLVRSARRSREFAVRAALGAGRAELAGSVLSESALLAAVGGTAGLGLAWLGTKAFLALAPAGIPRLDNVGLDGGVFAFAVGASLATLLLFGLLPALRTGDTDLADALKGASARTSDAGGRLRRGLVVAEVALAVVLLATAGLLARSFVGFLRWEPGFEREGLAAVSVYLSPEALDDVAGGPEGEGGEEGAGRVTTALDRAEEVARAVPGVVEASFASAIPLLGGREPLPYRVEGAPPVADEDLPRARVFDVSPGYFATLGVPVVRGRPFRPGDVAASAPVLVVNESFATSVWPGEDAVGRRLVVPGGVWGDEDVEYRIVGVVADVHPLTPGEEPEPEAYRSNRQYARTFPYLLVRATGDPADAAARVRERLLAEVSPELSVTVQGTMTSLMERRLVRPRFNVALIGAFAGAALLLTLVGVYGVLAYAVVQRNREMGIRLALGSGRGRVLKEVLAEGVEMALVGVALGVAGCVAVAGVVASVVYGVPPTDPVTLGGTALLVVALAAGASFVPALRASRVDPVGLLKEE